MNNAFLYYTSLLRWHRVYRYRFQPISPLLRSMQFLRQKIDLTQTSIVQCSFLISKRQGIAEDPQRGGAGGGKEQAKVENAHIPTQGALVCSRLRVMEWNLCGAGNGH